MEGNNPPFYARFRPSTSYACPDLVRSPISDVERLAAVLLSLESS
jgi:hypothetical protein